MSDCCPFCQSDSGVFQRRYVTYEQNVDWDGYYDATALMPIRGKYDLKYWRCIDCKKIIKDPPEMIDQRVG